MPSLRSFIVLLALAPALWLAAAGGTARAVDDTGFGAARPEASPTTVAADTARPAQTPQPSATAPAASQPPKACCKVCRKGKACGNSCISRAKSCHQPPGCACDG